MHYPLTAMIKNGLLLLLLSPLIAACSSGSNSPPHGDFTTSVTSGEAPLAVTFDATTSSDSDGTILRYRWDYGDGSSGEGITADHTYTQSGSYSVTLTVIDNAGGRDTVTRQQYINVAAAYLSPQAVIGASPNSGNVPLLVDFDASGSSDGEAAIADYSWDFGDGNTGNGLTTSHTYTEAGSYTATLTVTDNNGISASDSVTINVMVMLSGTISAAAGSGVDSDTNDPYSPYTPNNAIAQAQPITSPVVLGGFVSDTPTGNLNQDRFAETSDEWDFYRVTLLSGLVIELEISDWSDGQNDLDLYLYATDGTLIDASVSALANETLTVPADGEYLIGVNATNTSISNYLLRIDTASALSAKPSMHLSSEFRSGEMIVSFKPAAMAAGLSLSKRSADIGLVKKGGAIGRPALLALPGGDEREAAFKALGMKAAAVPGHFANAQQQEKLTTLLAIKAVERRSDVEHAVPNYILRPTAEPNDPRYADQWHYPLINLPQAWDLTTGSTGVIVAVIDTGVYLAHPDLSSQLTPGYDFISDPTSARDGDGIDASPDDPGDSDTLGLSSWHGTHVAGTVAAASNNTVGVSGVAWNSRIMPLRTNGLNGGSSYDIQQAIRYAAGLDNDSGTLPAEPADIINMSLGCLNCYETLTPQEISAARAQGVIVIAAAGNDSSSTPSYPASYDGVVSVSAVGPSKEKAYYSNYGDKIDVAAPGGEIVTAYEQGILSTFVDDTSGSRSATYNYLHGTSMASPHMAGVVALMKAVHPGLTPDELDTALSGGHITDDLGPTGRDNDFGHGLINALKAVEYAQVLANAAGPSTLLLDSSYLNFSSTLSSASVNLSEGGNPTTSSISVSSTAAWLSTTPVNVDGNGLGEYQVNANRTGLNTGSYSGSITFSSDSGATATLQVDIYIGTYQASDNTGHLWVMLSDENGNKVAVEHLDASDGSYHFQFNSVPAGSYTLTAGSDMDSDDHLCDNGESCGSYPDISAPTVLNATTDIDTLDFGVSFGTGSGVGQAYR